MKSVLRYTAAGLALATVGFASSASAATFDDAQVQAEILSTLRIVAVTGDSVLDFGQIAPNAGMTGTSTVTIAAATGAATCGATLTCSGTTNAPSFTVTGLSGSTVAVSIPASTLLTGPAVVPAGMVGTMTVGTFTTNLAANPVVLTTGSATFNLGGTLTVAANQVPGVYTGSVTVSVAYN